MRRCPTKTLSAHGDIRPDQPDVPAAGPLCQDLNIARLTAKISTHACGSTLQTIRSRVEMHRLPKCDTAAFRHGAVVGRETKYFVWGRASSVEDSRLHELHSDLGTHFILCSGVPGAFSCYQAWLIHVLTPCAGVQVLR